jgi:hypothetical protein
LSALVLARKRLGNTDSNGGATVQAVTSALRLARRRGLVYDGAAMPYPGFGVLAVYAFVYTLSVCR